MRALSCYLLLFSVGIAAPAVAAAEKPGPAPEFLRYHASIPLSNPGIFDLIVRTDGSATITLDRHTDQPAILHLNKNELQALASTARFTGFFKLPARIAATGTDQGTEILAITDQGEQHRVEFADAGQLRPLTALLWSMINQVRLISRLNRDDAALSEASSALSPHTVSGRIFQPRALRGAIEDALSRTKDQHRLAEGFEALSAVTDPVEFVGAVARELEHSSAEREGLIYEALAQLQALEHRKALAPLLVQRLMDRVRKPGPIAPEEQMKWFQLSWFIGDSEYYPALPAMLEILRMRPESGLADYPIIAIGPLSIEPLERALQDEKPAVRGRAATLLSRLVNPSTGSYLQHTPRRDLLAQIRYHLRHSSLPKLQKLSEADPQPEVRKAAADAARAIEQLKD